MGIKTLLRPRPSISASSTGWQRPSDWLALPTDAPNTVAILACVDNHSSNFAAFSATVTGGFTMSWGDGTTTTHASGATAEKLYDWNNSSLGPSTVEGWKQVLVTITPTVPGNAFTALSFGAKHSRAGLSDHGNPWVDLRINAPSCTALSLSSTATSKVLTALSVTGFGPVTNASFMFANLPALQYLSLPTGFGALINNASYMFYYTSALRYLSLPTGFGALINNASYMFSYMYALQYLSLPTGFGALINNASSMFISLSELQYLSLPTGFCALINNAANMFTNITACARLGKPAIPVSFSVAGMSLGGAELDEIYTSLPTVTGQTITVTGNHGIADHHPSIATAKGWTVAT